MIPRALQSHEVDRRRMLVAVAALLVLATTLALPVLHETFHAAGAPEVDCPVQALQVGFSLVLVSAAVLPLLGSRPSAGVVPRPAPAPRISRRTAAAPRAPPHRSSHSI